MRHNSRTIIKTIFCLLAAQALLPIPATGLDPAGPEEIIQAGDLDIDVPGFSVPSFVRWDGDALPDLVIGEGGLGLDDGKVRVYLNAGAPGNPAFGGFFYVQSNGTDLVSPSSG